MSACDDENCHIIPIKISEALCGLFSKEQYLCFNQIFIHEHRGSYKQDCS